MGGIETFFIVVAVLVLIILFAILTKPCWMKFWRQSRGYPESRQPPIATLAEPADREHVVLDGIPFLVNGRRQTSSSLNTEDGNHGRVPLADEPNTFAHDWFQSGMYKNVERADIEFIQELGKGWFGKVLEARIKRMNPFNETTTVVVKQLSEDSSTRDQVRFLHEARLYRDGDQPDTNILKLAKFSIEKSPFLLIFEKWPLGDLKGYLRTFVTPEHLRKDPSLLIRMAIDIAKALTWMEEYGFVHGDLSARNCLVTNTAGRIIIGDYGLSPTKYREDYYWTSEIALPIRWAAPETVSCVMDTIISTKVTYASNVWTFGIVMWEILELGQRPYPNLTDAQVLDQVITGKTYVLEKPVNPYFSDKFMDNFYSAFMLPCLNYDPATRPSISQVLTALSTPASPSKV